MKIKLGNILVRVRHNKNNRFWNPNGRFQSIQEVRIGGEWYKCGLRYKREKSNHIIQITDPMIVDDETSLVRETLMIGTYREIKTTYFKITLLKYLKKDLKINSISYNIRRRLSKRKNTIAVFILAFIFSSAYYLLNTLNENSLMNYIAENIWIQTVIFFLTISSFINIFFPFTIKKELSIEDVKKIAENVIEEQKKDEELENEFKY